MVPHRLYYRINHTAYTPQPPFVDYISTFHLHLARSVMKRGLQLCKSVSAIHNEEIVIPSYLRDINRDFRKIVHVLRMALLMCSLVCIGFICYIATLSSWNMTGLPRITRNIAIFELISRWIYCARNEVVVRNDSCVEITVTWPFYQTLTAFNRI